MSNSYYCAVCIKEILEIKNTDSLVENIGDIIILCEECEKTHQIMLREKIMSNEQNIEGVKKMNENFERKYYDQMKEWYENNN